MKKLKFINEKGSMTILLVFIVATVSAILVFNASSAFNTVNKQHSRQRQKTNFQPHMHKLAQLLHQSYVSAQIDPSCASFGVGSIKPQKINGASFCIDQNKGLCVDTSQGNFKSHFCLSTKKKAFEWEKNMGFEKISTQKNISPSQQSSLVKKNRIVIPSTSDKTLWRDCASTTCVRLVLCPEGVNNCEIKDAIASQVVRLGALE